MKKLILYYIEQGVIRLYRVRYALYSSFGLTLILFLLNLFNIYPCSWLLICMPIGVVASYFLILLGVYILFYFLCYFLD